MHRVFAALLLAGLAGTAHGQSLEHLARAFADHPTPQTRAALLRFATAHPDSQSGALARLKIGTADLAAKRFADAFPNLEPAVQRVPAIADHAGFLAATAAFELSDDAAVQRLLEPVWKQTDPISPYTGRAAILADRSFTRTGQARRALELLQQKYAWLPRPAGDLALAVAFEAASDPLNAVPRYQNVYYGYPLSDEAVQAGEALARLRTELGDRFPPVMPAILIGRATKLLDGGRAVDARREFEELLPQLAGGERESAALRIGVARYRANDTKPAFSYLQTLSSRSPELNAERIYWIIQCARRLDDTVQIRSALDTLERDHPTSRWRLEALVSAGDYYLLINQYAQYEPLYRTCYQAFPTEPRAAYCHWKVAFSRYLRTDAAATGLLRDHVRLYPQSDKAAAALYFLGRLAERTTDPGSARAWYDEIEQNYPNTYYQVLARARLKDPSVRKATPAASVRSFLDSVLFPERIRRADFQPDPQSRKRIARARLLSSAALDEVAETELTFAARTDERPQVYAVELARSAERRGAFGQGIRYIKAHAPGFLLYPMDAAPAEFWRLAFPMPYRDPLVRYSRAVNLDPYIVAALTRQESEFDPNVISRANAYGLTQILPSTGRELARRILGVRHFRTEMLFRPDTNLHLGTVYLRQMLNSFNGRWEPALASYNAGHRRVDAWLGWAEYREPAEYVENIPFTETRNYVQMVLRNADIYRTLYNASPPETMKRK